MKRGLRDSALIHDKPGQGGYRGSCSGTSHETSLQAHEQTRAKFLSRAMLISTKWLQPFHILPYVSSFPTHLLLHPQRALHGSYLILPYFCAIAHAVPSSCHALPPLLLITWETYPHSSGCSSNITSPHVPSHFEHTLNIHSFCHSTDIGPKWRLCQALSYHALYHLHAYQLPLLVRLGLCLIHLNVLSISSNA